MPLSWNEIKSRAARFSHEWKDTHREEADAKPFLLDFLKIFDISEKRYYNFEHRVKKIDQSSGYIDLLWPGMILVEMKSRGQDLDKAYQQAVDYCHGLKDYELPKLIMVCDFHHFHIYEKGVRHEFELHELVEYLHLFQEIAGYQKRSYYEEDPVNVEAAELMGKLHDQLKDVGYTGSALEIYLVRLVFVLFADDSTIWQKGLFLDYLEFRTKEDGSDLAMHLDQLFQVLDTPENKRLRTLDEQLNLFPYVNGRLFTDRLPTAAFNSGMRQILLDSCRLDWGKISPAIFGSLFQSVMDKEHRRNLGAHYTSEKNILKVIQPLFMDELWDEFQTCGSNVNKLKQLHHKISKLRFLDPACGCGNFLITAYRELKYLEIAIVEKLLKGQSVTNINHYFLVNLNQFYGIEYSEFPSQIAQVAMWLIDHQINMVISDKFGEYIPSIPLIKSAVIVHGNALRLDWQSIIRPFEVEPDNVRFDFILGNPPFIGHQWRNDEQIQDMEFVFGDAKRSGRLDYVSAWYLKSAKYLNEINNVSLTSGNTKCAFVSTNSISQGEQVSILWAELFRKYSIKIHFAHRTFKWSNEAKGNAAVHVVIIGFSNFDTQIKKIFEYESVSGNPIEILVKNINPYLTEGKDIFIESRSKPIHGYPQMIKGSQPTDGGFLVLTVEEYENLIKIEPSAKKFIKSYLGAREFINSELRYCLWLKGIEPNELRSMPAVLERVQKVKEIRLQSPTLSVKNDAKIPHLFTQDRQPKSNYLVIPEVSSINRDYIPIGFLTPDIICSNKLQIISDATLYMFGVLQSNMHMTWTRYVSGRMKSDISYSPQVYHNFPWPEDPSNKQKKLLEDAAQNVLNVRLNFPRSSLADLYDPNTMPPELVKAHQQLDKAVDQCYRSQPFPTEAKRIEYLFQLYEKYTAGLFSEVVKKKSKKSSKKGAE